jgi:pimeloyl-ACP methyl ester carboxylesterase
MKSSLKIIKTILISIFTFVILIILFFGYSDKSVSQLSQKYAPNPSKFITIDGMDVHYRDEGNLNDSIPIVLIHGTGSSLHTFDGWTNGLKENRRILRMDIPAFGLTGPFLNRKYTIKKYVAFIEHFLAAKKISTFILAGNSLGGEIAWQFTIKNPKKVEKLILIDASGYPFKPESLPIGLKVAQIPILNNILTIITPRFMVKASIENVYADKTKVTKVLVNRYFELTLRAGNRQALIDRMTTKFDTIESANIKNIQQPTLILWGEQDQLIPVHNAYRFHNDLPNDTLVILKNSGHVPMEENPKESLKAVLSFLKN